MGNLKVSTKTKDQVQETIKNAIRTASNYVQCTPAEPHGGASQTIPDQTYTPQQLLERMARGLPLDKLSNHFYSGDDFFPEIRKMDLTEQDDAIKAAAAAYKQQEGAEWQKVLRRRKEAADRAKAQREWEAAQKKAAEKPSTVNP